MWKRGCFNALGWQKWALTACHYPLMINVAVCPKCILVHSNIWGVFSCTPNKSPWMSQNDRVLFAPFVFQRRTHPPTKAARNALQNSRILKSSQNEEWRMTEKADVFTAQTRVEYQEHVKLSWNYHRLHPTSSNMFEHVAMLRARLSLVRQHGSTGQSVLCAHFAACLCLPHVSRCITNDFVTS